MNTELIKEAKHNFEKNFFKLVNNAFFGKTIENLRKHRDIKLVTTGRVKNYLVSEPIYRNTYFFTENLLVIEMKKTQITMSTLVYSGLSILDLSKTLRYEFWYDFVKPKYGEKSKLCYIDTDSFNVHVKTKDIYREIAENVEKRSDISTFEIDRPLLVGKNKVIGLIKTELGGQINKKICWFITKLI